jgi:TolB-like protein
MSADDPQTPDRPYSTVFLSYAKEDRAAVQLIRDALPKLGLEAWYDESDLLGGDAWDEKIRRQIRDCDFFMPVISANTETRREGYFRREWRLAVERTLDMTDDTVFLVPVVLDDTAEARARVPDKFRAVQWTRVPGGRPNAALEALCHRLVSGDPEAPPGQMPATRTRARHHAPPPPRREFPTFPREEPGQRARFWAQVILWTLQSIWVGFQRLPKWVRVLVYCWIAVLLLRWSTHPSQLSSAQVKKLAQMERLALALKNHSGGPSATPAAKEPVSITRPTGAVAATAPNAPPSALVIPFFAPPGDRYALQFATAVFAKLYGRLLVTRHGHIALSVTPLLSLDSAAAEAQGRAEHSDYVLYGGVEGHASKLMLTIRILSVANGAVLWSRAYPLTGADPARIASDTAAAVPRLARD